MIGKPRAVELLKVVESFGERGCTPEEFGREALPGPGWDELPKHPKRNARPGGRMVSASAGLLGQMRGMGLVCRRNGRYFATLAAPGFIAAATGGKPTAPPEKRSPLRARREQAAIAPPPAQWVPWSTSPSGWAWWDGCCGYRVPDSVGGYFFVPLGF